MQNPHSFPLEMQEIMMEADELLVLQITDSNPLFGLIAQYNSIEGYLSGYPIIRSVKIDSLTERERLTKAIAKGIKEGDEISRCFFPNHALTAKRGAETLELIICFRCDWIQAALNGEHFNFPTSNFSEAIFDSFLPEYVVTRDAWSRVREIVHAVDSYSYPIPTKIADDLSRIAECEAWLEENSQIEGVIQMRARLQQLRDVLNERAKQKRER